ncbi:sodium/potassium-transporting ATPase subunit beta-1-interacting protein isoform X1 [Episyrphus balteatus]|uniref:sodium/potassium-transporting ATPase subunit beta-1-interacting protein isoform X1 n=1 Tax=Episyrphus balteatus TaxID=286459 RepID=UPI0024864E71|nr:sodium/potassium-transporting ATPase subunit beta-1-interacting protein isoform X1 [Episyrphus balteatus]
MGSCTRRHFLLSTCFLQLITIIERQVFDFLGYMWAPIFANFLHIIFVIFGFYGAYHFRVKYIITYLIWSIIWIGWNSFLICFYLNVGELDRDSDILNLGTGSVSWFEVNGYGCKPTYPTNITSDDPYRPIRPEHVDDCLLEYHLIEVVHSGVQCFLATLAIIGSIMISYIFLDEDDRFDFMNGDAKSPQHTVVHPMYVSYTSIPTSASATMLSFNKHKQYLHNNNSNNNKSHSNSILSNLHNHTIINNQYYDDSTATADQLFTNSNNNAKNKFNAHHQHQLQAQQIHQHHPSQSQQPQLPPQPPSTTINTQSSTSYTSLNRDIASDIIGTAPTPNNSVLSTMSASFDRNLNLNNLSQRGDKSATKNNSGGGKKCKTSSSYSSFINSNRPDIKYTQMSTEQLVKAANFDASIEDIIALQTFNSADKHGMTYVPFQKPVPAALFVAPPTPGSISNDNNNFLPTTHVYSPTNNNNNTIPEDGPPVGQFTRDNSQFFNCPPVSNAFENRAYNNATPPNIPVQQIPRQFQRSGQYPYPDLSPDVTEKYSMPYQYVPRSPVASRIAARRRQDRSHVTNFCDQIRDTPPGYADTGFAISRAKSHDRLSSRGGINGSGGMGGVGYAAAAAGGYHQNPQMPHPPSQLIQMQYANDTNNGSNNRHSRMSNGSERNNKPRPRSYCNPSNVSYDSNNTGEGDGGDGHMC